MIDHTSIIYALLGGILPALVWLTFWLREDYKRPEPRGLILKTFFFGMVAVILVIPFQQAVDSYIPGLTILTISLWIILEELFKLCAAYFGGLKSFEDNEPLDPLIYMITAALGFAALENALFILRPILDQNLLDTVITGNLRFIGASLLHVVASGFIGVALSISFYKTKLFRIIVVLIGLIAAILFHIAFNVSLLNGHGLLPLILVWVGVIFILLAFERIKTIAR